MMDGVFGFLRKSSHGESAAEHLRRRFSAFQALLAANNAALELMADMEEKRSGEFLFDRAYLTRSVEQIVSAVGQIVSNLDALSKGKYPGLGAAHARIAAEITLALERRAEIPADGPLVLPLAAVTGGATLLAGGKMAHLGEIRNRVGLLVPDGFVITSTAYTKFVEHNRLADRISAELESVHVESLQEVEQASERLQRLVREAAVPPEVAAAIAEGLAALDAPGNGNVRFAVRSSAVREDGELSFAGQYATFLDVPPGEVAARYAEVLASLFSPRAVFYCLTKGFTPEELVMAVGVVRMVEASSGGVAYSRDPNDPARDELIVSGAPGLGTAVVDGSGPHDTYRVARGTGEVVGRRLAGEHPVLTDAQCAEIARAAELLERHYGAPQDVEWAFSRDGRLHLLQSRELRLLTHEATAFLPRRFPGHRVLLDGGEIAARGAGCGPVVIVREESELAGVPHGAVLVARTTSPRYVTVMPRLAAIVTDVGGTTGHLASLAREYGVPALLDTGSATKALAQGQEVTVDAINGTVYEGRVTPLLDYTASRREPLRETPLVRTLEAVLRHVAPLNLIDPAAPEFSPQDCRTLHDVTRFAHEKGMLEMFEVGSDRELADKGTITLLAGIPVGVHLLDLGGGVRPGVKKASPEDVLSVPLAAMLKGMREMRWPDPPPVDAGGFLGMVARTATLPEEEILATGERSFAIVGANYLHFSIRLGYHFSLIEAYVGERLNDNYIRFFFKGGGAVRDRRLRRVRLIGDILRVLDFQVKVTDDVIDAAVLKFRRPELEAKLRTLGKLTAYTKQLDMAMFNDDVTDWYRNEFINEHLPPG